MLGVEFLVFRLQGGNGVLGGFAHRGFHFGLMDRNSTALA
jgi:hypothetical protein